MTLTYVQYICIRIYIYIFFSFLLNMRYPFDHHFSFFPVGYILVSWAPLFLLSCWLCNHHMPLITFSCCAILFLSFVVSVYLFYCVIVFPFFMIYSSSLFFSSSSVIVCLPRSLSVILLLLFLFIVTWFSLYTLVVFHWFSSIKIVPHHHHHCPSLFTRYGKTFIYVSFSFFRQTRSGISCLAYIRIGGYCHCLHPEREPHSFYRHPGVGRIFESFFLFPQKMKVLASIEFLLLLLTYFCSLVCSHISPKCGPIVSDIHIYGRQFLFLPISLYPHWTSLLFLLSVAFIIYCEHTYPFIFSLKYHLLNKIHYLLLNR